MKKHNWSVLKDLRKNFLQLEPKATTDYWQSNEVLKAYDETFARRIRWKWDAVLNDLLLHSPMLPGGPILDFGCGSGVASESVCEILMAGFTEEAHYYKGQYHQGQYHQGHHDKGRNEKRLSEKSNDQDSVPDQVATVRQSADQRAESSILQTHRIKPQFLMYDRSSLAINYSKIKIMQKNFDARSAKNPFQEKFSTVLASHVLTELDQDSFDDFLKVLRSSEMFILVDAGIPAVSQRLIAIRDIFREAGWSVIAPCTHAGQCPLKDSGNDWCHFHVTPPNEVFTESFWSEFSSEMGVDLRALSTSYLVMSKSNQQGYKGKRLIGAPKTTKFGLRAYFCGAKGFMAEDLRLSKSESKIILKNPFCHIYPESL